MKRKIRNLVIIGFIIFLLIQVYRPVRNTDDGQALPSHITKLYNVPDSVQGIFAMSCYDCHSNHTRYPWYSYIQPVRFIMEWDIRNAKEELNLSEFGNYSKRRQKTKLERISKQVESGEMPLFSYTIMHKNTKLTLEQKYTITRWIDTLLNNYK